MNNHSKLLSNIQTHGFEPRLRAYKNDEEATKGNYTYQYWSLPMDNGKWEKGDFFYKGNNDFMHFTSLKSVYNILNSKCIRLYNLLNMDDKYELEYGLRELKYPTNERFVNDKEELFCLSLCSTDEIQSDEIKEHLLWKLHGHNGYGAILRLNFKNNANNWYQYHLSKIFYDTNNMDDIKQLHSFPDNKEFLDPKLTSFFKNKIYSFEHEIRLIFDSRKDVSRSYHDKENNHLYPILHPDYSPQIDKILYFELPLYNFFLSISNYFNIPESDISSKKMNLEVPHIHISEIILGYRYSKQEINKIKSEIEYFDKEINVRVTNLISYYKYP